MSVTSSNPSSSWSHGEVSCATVVSLLVNSQNVVVSKISKFSRNGSFRSRETDLGTDSDSDPNSGMCSFS